VESSHCPAARSFTFGSLAFLADNSSCHPSLRYPLSSDTFPSVKVLFAILSLATCATAQVAGAGASGVTVSVDVRGFSDDRGCLLGSLFTSAAGFPAAHEHAFRDGTAAISNGAARVVFTNVPAGVCAVSVCHDRNGNGRLDQTLFGRPVEGYGLSGHGMVRAGPPRFEDSGFRVSTNDVFLLIRLVYPERRDR
jgi:uncharacterized protein (DUF2141 family)